MKSELQEALKQKFPTLFPLDTVFRCEDGWYELIYAMAEELANRGEVGSFNTVKEKFGELRAYMNSLPAPSEPSNLPIIRKYENMSARTCEMCGSTEGAGIVESGGWPQCRCRECLLKTQLELL